MHIWNEIKYEIQENKLITQSWRNWESSDLLYINSQDRKPLLQSTQKGPAHFSSFYCIFIQIYIWWNLNHSRIFNYNKKEINHFISLSLSLFGTRSLPSRILGTSDASFHQLRYQPWRFRLTIGLKRVKISG